MKDATRTYEVESRTRHAERPGFRISELRISPTQTIPWHIHTHIDDTFYVLNGRLRLFLRDPEETIDLEPGQTYCVVARRPHLVTNTAGTSSTFLVLQGLGEYDFIHAA